LCTNNKGYKKRMGFVSAFHQVSTFGISSHHLPVNALHLQHLSDESILSILPTFLPISLDHDMTISPLMLSCIAGASTSLGALIVFFLPKHKPYGDDIDDRGQQQQQQQEFMNRFLSFSLSLAASVMITVSVISILPESLEGIIQYTFGDGFVITSQEQFVQRMLGFGLGCLAYFLLSLTLSVLPEPDSIFNNNNSFLRDHERYDNQTDHNVPIYSSDMMTMKLLEEDDLQAERRRRSASWRMAILIFISLLLHNAPEGFAVAASAVESNQLGLIVTIGIMMHNIPEGLAIAVPCIVAEPDRPWFAFALASISGLAEPIGALVALKLLHNDDINMFPMGNVLAGVAGIMCMVSVRELYPEALHHEPQTLDEKKYHSTLLAGTVCGIAIMSATEFLLTPR